MTEHNQQPTQVHWRPLEDLLQPQGGRVQELSGFDDEFTDIVDYIIRITHRIWEQKNVGLCYDYYSDDCPVYTLGGYVEGVETVVQNTLKTIAAFPDRSLIGENVVWRDHGNGDYYSSHRITSIMTNTGHSEFGPATGMTGRVTTVADCVCRENRIVYEWLMRDNSFLVKQLGLEPMAVAKRMSKAPTHPEFDRWWDSEHQRVCAIDHLAEKPFVCAHESPQGFAEAWAMSLFNQKRLKDIETFYQPNARVQWPGGRQAVGVRAITGTIVQWLAQCADAKVSVDHVAASAFESEAIDLAIRWTLAGEFSARDESLAACTGQPMLVLASTHLRIVDGKISEEWTVFDELALNANLLRRAGVEVGS